jgi:hypothetical protein
MHKWHECKGRACHQSDQIDLLHHDQHFLTFITVVLWSLKIALLSAAIVGKSQFMQYAAKLSPRAVMSSGRGSSSAGLTVTAIKDGGQWALEAGALVLADGTFLPFSTSMSSM